MTSIGERDKRIRFQASSSARSALGGKTPGPDDWHDLGGRWAKVLYGTGAERRAAAVEGAVQTATFNCRLEAFTAEITTEHRIAFDGLYFDITGIAKIRRSEIEFTGTASRG